MTTIIFDDLQPIPQTPAQAEDAALEWERNLLAIVREDIGMNERLAGAFARVLVDGLRHRLGGQELYIPAPDRSERDASIRREFCGGNIDELMKKHALSRASIYAIAGAGRKSAKSNPALPLETGQAAA